MRTALPIVACVAMLLTATAALVQELSSPAEDARALCEQALDRLMVGDIEGVDLFCAPDHQPREVDLQVFRAQIGAMTDHIARCGKPLGYELLEEKQYGSTFLRCKYVAKYEQKFVIWTFLLIRLDGPWFLHRVDFNTDLKALFE